VGPDTTRVRHLELADIAPNAADAERAESVHRDPDGAVTELEQLLGVLVHLEDSVLARQRHCAVDAKDHSVREVAANGDGHAASVGSSSRADRREWAARGSEG
jgi:hypothetical protein